MNVRVEDLPSLSVPIDPYAKMFVNRYGISYQTQATGFINNSVVTGYITTNQQAQVMNIITNAFIPKTPSDGTPLRYISGVGLQFYNINTSTWYTLTCVNNPAQLSWS